MPKVKLAIIYYSATGTIYQMAQAAADAAREAGAEVRMHRVKEIAPDEAIDRNPHWRAHLEATKDVPLATLDDLEWADAYIFAAGTRFGNVPAQLKEFMDTAGGLWSQGKLADKLASGMTSAANPHGGQESTLLTLFNTFYHWGALVVTTGYTAKSVYDAGGNPYGPSAEQAAGKKVAEEALEDARYLARRMVKISGWLLKGKNS